MRWPNRVGAIRFVKLGAADVACPVDRAALLPTYTPWGDSRLLSGAAAFAVMWPSRCCSLTACVLSIYLGAITRAGLRNEHMVCLVSDRGDGIRRHVGPLKVTPYELPDRFLGGYHLGMNPLIALSRYDTKPKMPAYKGVPLRIAPVPA